MASILILNGTLVNENRIFESDILIKDGIIEKIDKDLSHMQADRPSMRLESTSFLA